MQTAVYILKTNFSKYVGIKLAEEPGYTGESIFFVSFLNFIMTNISSSTISNFLNFTFWVA